MKTKPYYEQDGITIYHGDCKEILSQFDVETIDLIITSPPYPGSNAMWGELFKDENFIEAHYWLNDRWDECLRTLKTGCKLCINIANTKRRPYLPNTHKIYEWAEDKIEALGEIIWNKGYGQFGTAWGSYRNPSDPSLADQHEYILIFRKYGNRARQKGYHLSAQKFKSWRNSMWNISPAKAKKTGHVAPFPKEIPGRLIQLYSYKNETILDPYCGIGTTLQIAKELGRKAIGIDTNKEYCEKAAMKLAQRELFTPL